jgi:hypothetical protein
MNPGSAPALPLQPLRLLRLLLAFCLLLGAWTVAAAHLHADGGHGAAAAPCHGQPDGSTAAGHGHAATAVMSVMPAPSSSHAPDGCCGSSAACHAHCGMGAAMPVAQAALPTPLFARTVLRQRRAARYAPPAPDRLIRPPISA